MAAVTGISGTDNTDNTFFEAISRYFANEFIIRMYETAKVYATGGVSEKYLERAKIYADSIRTREVCYNTIVNALFEYIKTHNLLRISSFRDFSALFVVVYVPESETRYITEESVKSIMGKVIQDLVSALTLMVTTKENLKIIINDRDNISAFMKTFILESMEILKTLKLAFYRQFTNDSVSAATPSSNIVAQELRNKLLASADRITKLNVILKEKDTKIQVLEQNIINLKNELLWKDEKYKQLITEIVNNNKQSKTIKNEVMAAPIPQPTVQYQPQNSHAVPVQEWTVDEPPISPPTRKAPSPPRVQQHQSRLPSCEEAISDTKTEVRVPSHRDIISAAVYDTKINKQERKHSYMHTVMDDEELPDFFKESDTQKNEETEQSPPRSFNIRKHIIQDEEDYGESRML